MISRKRSTALPLKPGEQMIPRATSTVVRTRPLLTYFPINSGIYGRDEDKAKILEMVLSDELSFSVISIVGMGAIGKTRLVQEVYNDKALEGFDMRAWVDVSYGTDIQQICKQLLQQITLSSRRIYGLQELLIALAKAVAGKKFLFVLDDVWIENYNREAFWRPFKAGAAGSKLIMTTRNVAVALTMQPSKCYNLNLLIKDACWATFEEYALGIRSINPQRTSPLIQEKVVEKIQGLLLAARTPSVMLSSKHRNQWENILNDKIFNYSYESKIIPVLETSYLYLYISQCPSVTFLSSRDQLFVGQKHLDIRDCSGLRTLLLQGQLPTTLEHLEISGCSELIRFSTNGLLPKMLKHLDIADCPKLKSIAKSFDKGTFVGFIQIKNCKNLEFIPEGIHNMDSLHTMYVQDCPSLVSFPSKGFPNTNLTVLSIERCEKLTALPSRLQNLHCLQQLVTRQCPSIMSIPKEGFPANLTSLSIADVSLYNSLFEWGLHNLTSLRYLEIRGCLDAICFPIEEMSMVLPTSLTQLTIRGFPKLKYLSSRGFETLKSLEELSISDCPELSSFPESLPSSLLQLYISNCPSLKKHCRRNKGQEWSKIADIPRVRIDYEFIYDT